MFAVDSDAQSIIIIHIETVSLEKNRHRNAIDIYGNGNGNSNIGWKKNVDGQMLTSNKSNRPLR